MSVLAQLLLPLPLPLLLLLLLGRAKRWSDRWRVQAVRGPLDEPISEWAAG